MASPDNHLHPCLAVQGLSLSSFPGRKQIVPVWSTAYLVIVCLYIASEHKALQLCGSEFTTFRLFDTKAGHSIQGNTCEADYPAYFGVRALDAGHS